MRKLSPLILALFLAQLSLPVPAAEPGDTEFKEFVFTAVLRGLYRQGLPDPVVDRLLARDLGDSGQPYLFVYACPICHPTYDALLLYRSRQPMWGDKGRARDFDTKVDAAMLARLSADDPAVRAGGLSELLRGFIADEMALRRFTPEEKAVWQKKFDEARQRGLDQLKAQQGLGVKAYSWMKSCQMCEGANRGAGNP